MREQIIRKMKSRGIAEYFRKRILSRRLKAGTVLLSAPQIVRDFKCCLATANHALDILEEEGLIVREKGRGSIVRDNLFNGRKLILGVADELHRHTNPFRKALLEVFPENALHYFKKHNCDYRIITYLAFMEQDRDIFSELDGLLISLNYLSPGDIPFLRSLDIPIVIYRGEYEIDLPYPQIVPEFQTAAEQLFLLASRENFREILIVHADHPNGLARCEAFLKQAGKAGYPKEKIRTLICRESHVEDIDTAELKGIRGKLIISCSDLVTYDLIRALGEMDFVCGSDYQIVGVDNLAGLIDLPEPAYPRVTSIGYALGKAAQTAAKLLIGLSSRSGSGCYQVIKFPTELTLRDSAFRKE